LDFGIFLNIYNMVRTCKRLTSALGNIREHRTALRWRERVEQLSNLRGGAFDELLWLIRLALARGGVRLDACPKRLELVAHGGLISLFAMFELEWRVEHVVARFVHVSRNQLEAELVGLRVQCVDELAETLAADGHAPLEIVVCASPASKEIRQGERQGVLQAGGARHL